MLKKLNIIILALISLTIISCSDSTETKVIQKQRAGDYLVSISSTTGDIKNGSGKFYIEFRTVSGEQLTDAGKVEASAIMHMPGMPMTADITVKSTDQIGRYEVMYNFSMSGTWILEMSFSQGKKTRFSLVVN